MNYYTRNPEAFEPTDQGEISPLPSVQLHIDLKGRTNQSYAVAILRDDYSMTFAQIAEKMQISTSRAAELYHYRGEE